MKTREIAALEAALEYRFQRPELIEQALTHSSQARERESQQGGAPRRLGDNEQLEFLGDAVLALLSSEELYRRFPHFHEGQLSKLRAHLVSEKHLSQVAQQLELGHYLRLGRGEEKSGGRAKNALLADALEAVLAAIYLDGGLEAARDFVQRRVLHPELQTMANAGTSLPVTDFKSTLQEALQAAGRRQPVYVLVKQEGPEHKKTFTVEARLAEVDSATRIAFVGRAEGTTKKHAEQEAARQVLDHLASLPTVIPREDH
jgi:ribonuclease-3